MIKKVLSLVLATAFINLVPNNVANSEYVYDVTQSTDVDFAIPQSIGLISSGKLQISVGTKKLHLNMSTNGTSTMREIGFKNICVERSSNGSSWTVEKTISDLTISNNSNYQISDYTVSVLGGYYYRVRLDHYAKENTWWFPDEEYINATSNSVWIS